jgi:quinolinate synthase
MNDNQQNEILHRIEKLRKEKDVVLLAHYYVDGEVQKIADYVGDSFYLAKVATQVTQQNILFCGVKFMGESAKLLNPSKNVIMADDYADCPMAHMITAEKIREVKAKYDDLSVVCYVNSTADAKSESDVCVTSSNALKVVKNIKEKNIFFVPDNNLGRFIAEQLPEKNFIFNDGYCHVHKSINRDAVLEAKKLHPDAVILTHPECTMDILEISDYVGSTSQIIDYATNSDDKEFIICTEVGVFYELQMKNPEKKFYSAVSHQVCQNMKKVTLDKVLEALEKMGPYVELPDEIMEKAANPLFKMLELAK